MPSRINNIFGTTDISRRFRLEGESDGWAFYLLDLPKQFQLLGEIFLTAEKEGDREWLMRSLV